MKKYIRIFLTVLAFALFALSNLFAAGTISASDLPDGFAGEGFKKISVASPVTVSTKKDLLSALKRGGVIFIDGMIDMSDGMLPGEGGGSSPALDEFVKNNSKFSSYIEYRDAYAAACSSSTEDSLNSSAKSSLYETMYSLNTAYKRVISVPVSSDTMIIGLGGESGFSGGTISISGVSNVILRNLLIKDAYDPFPHHEANDGYNAQHDGISVVDSKNVWIDHCTVMDTKDCISVKTGGKISEKWQTYDGLCDITKRSDNVTVSYCKFMNHSKTMLIGSSDSEKIDAKERHVTLHHNYFYNCASRLPMVRLTTIHVYNNYYDGDSKGLYKNSYALGVRYNSLIHAENNYYGAGISNSFAGSSKKPGTVYSVGEVDKSKNKKKTGEFKTAKEASFAIPYKYEAVTAEEVPEYVKSNSGAGVLEVLK